MKKLFPCFFFTLSVLLPSAAQAGAWVRSPQESYSKLAVSRFRSDEIYDPKGKNKLSGPEFKDVSVSWYTEYGLSSRWTAVASVPFKTMTSTLSGRRSSESGFSDAWLFLKRGLTDGPAVLSFQMGAKIPLGYSETRTPPLGQGQVDWEGRLLLGRSFYPFPGYGNVEAGYRRRNGPFSDEIPYRGEVGVFLAKPALVKFSLDGVDNRVNDDAGEIATFSTRPPHVFDQEYLKFSPALIFFLPRGFALEAAYETVIDGGNTAAGHSMSVGFAWQGKI